MFQTVEAIIDSSGQIRLLGPVQGEGERRALVMILDYAEDAPNEAALLSQASLGADWNRPEEDAAWSYLQPAT
jgi:hypothetical protein